MRAAQHTPLEWRVHGFRAGLEWCARECVYRASVAELPGCFARGATRAETLRRLAAAIERHLSAETDATAALN